MLDGSEEEKRRRKSWIRGKRKEILLRRGCEGREEKKRGRGRLWEGVKKG